MSVLPIRLWPDPVLQQVCRPVAGEVRGEVTELITDMFDTMYAAPGRGLAAPQVGLALRLFVMDVTWKDGPGTPIACINPEIISVSDDMAGGDEGCLSIPGVTADVTRPAEITLRFTVANGARQELRLTGMAAKCAQHELDHLDGKVIFDRLAPEAAAALHAAYDTATPIR
ncbi:MULTISPECIES: peptide deformylase [unclassified Marinovum]